MPSVKQKKSLWEAASTYRMSLPGSPGEEYLRGRGLWDDRLKSLGLGYVAEPLPGHDWYKGWLAIPYLRWSPRLKWTCVSIRFRCIEDHDHGKHGKYMSNEGDSPHLYNAYALLEDRPDIAITEGEFDAMSVILGGLPAVGVPGVKSPEKHWWDPFEGYETVYLFVDNDDDGQGVDFAREVKRTLTNVVPIMADKGEDANSMAQKYGFDWYRERLKKDD